MESRNESVNHAIEIWLHWTPSKGNCCLHKILTQKNARETVSRKARHVSATTSSLITTCDHLNILIGSLIFGN